MKQIRQMIGMCFTALLLAVMTGCTQADVPANPTVEETAQAETVQAETAQEDIYTITDSCGRTVEIPKDIERIAPSGPTAQLVLYTLCPDKMVGLAAELSESELKYIDDSYGKLPVFGNFYRDTLNLESVMIAKPQVIIDIGEAKQSVKEDMDAIQDKTGIPTIFIEMEMDSIASAYQTLGEITGETKQAQEIISYVEETLTQTKSKLAEIPEEKRVSVYYGLEDGLTAVVKGTVHSEVVDYAGGINVADVEEAIRGGANEISMEQFLLWNPNVILFTPDSIYDTVTDKAEWQELEAVKSGRYYQIPGEPYNWMGRPPSVNRLIGVKWLSNLLYPQEFNYDMVKETQDFYKLFYHCDITEEQVKEILGKSTYKS